jgi:hypothetical protein
MGEFFQNNHHRFCMSPNFAARRWELDPTWQVMRVLAWVGLIQIATPQRAVYPDPRPQQDGEPTHVVEAQTAWSLRDGKRSSSSPPASTPPHNPCVAELGCAAP